MSPRLPEKEERRSNKPFTDKNFKTGKSATPSKGEKKHFKSKPAGEPKSERKYFKVSPADEAKGEKKYFKSKPADEPKSERKYFKARPADEAKGDKKNFKNKSADESKSSYKGKLANGSNEENKSYRSKSADETNFDKFRLADKPEDFSKAVKASATDKPSESVKKALNEKKQTVSKLIVTEPATLMEFLIASLKDQSRTTVKSLLTHQQITIENRVIKQFDYALKVGDEISISWGKGKDTLDTPLLKIVFEDKHLIVVEKSAGLLSIATQKERIKTAYSMLSEYVKKQHPGNKIFVVHRLDRETSGLMLFARNEEVQYRMQHNWKFAVNQRKYIAVVEGKLETGDGSGRGVVKSYLWESKALIVYSSPNPEDGQLAVTKYNVLRSNDQYSLLELELETGRKNQIRVQLNSIGYPLVGDYKYGGHESKLKRLALHAHVLSFTHPITGEFQSFETPIPESFQKMVK